MGVMQEVLGLKYPLSSSLSFSYLKTELPKNILVWLIYSTTPMTLDFIHGINCKCGLWLFMGVPINIKILWLT